MFNFTEDTLEGIKHGDYGSYNRLFFYYYGRLCAYVTEIIKDDFASEDIVQDLFIKLWTNHEKIEIKENIASYLFKSSKNAALNYLRNEKSKKNALLRIPFSPSSLNEDIINHEELLDTLDKCINDLPARSKEVFLLHRFEGLKQKEISEKLNISVKTIKNQIWKSLQFLKSCVERKGMF